MDEQKIYIGKNELAKDLGKVYGDIIEKNGNSYYKITNSQLMQPFLMNVVSNSDLWMFIASNGALTAGRKNSENALFPYYTDDKIFDSSGISGSRTIITLEVKDKTYIWEPFKKNFQGTYNITRNLYKSILGNKLIFEETNLDLNITFSYQWSNCDKFGFVRRSILKNHNVSDIKVRVIDGLLNILPMGISRRMQNEYSNLTDAYKKTELLGGSSLAAFILSSIPTDKAEPSEALKANIAWSAGLENYNILLSEDQIDAPFSGKKTETETDIRAKRGAYLIDTELSIRSRCEKEWFIIADVNKDQADFFYLRNYISSENDITKSLNFEIAKDDEKLSQKIACNDGFQIVKDELNQFRHCSNVLFNIMRGGVFDDNYTISKADFIQFVKKANKHIFEKHSEFFLELNDQLSLFELLNRSTVENHEIHRLCREYLPLTFSRRHGDPSRPWNHFTIDIKDENGNKKLDYEGNWRDIFQNWEALAISFPEFLENMILKFVNTSTADGYNPYRVTRDGFDWEEIEPDDEWSYIGYWGDHQIIYLLKLLEMSTAYHPNYLSSLLNKEIFTYSNVPYRIKSYQEILKDPKNTVDFDFELNSNLKSRVEDIGFDGRLCFYADNSLVYASFTEKLLLPLLTKLTNFIPEAGIWMNTQRPEWNDANNALVGYGCSMVTLYYIRRYINFLKVVFNNDQSENYLFHYAIKHLLDRNIDVFQKYSNILERNFSETERKIFLDEIGEIGSEYRGKLYNNSFKKKKIDVSKQDIIDLLDISLKYVDHSIGMNKRDDGLYHSYNLIKIEDGAIKIRRLYEMLEGQVAVLSSGAISIKESIEILQSLRISSLYRADQKSYMLYPNRHLKRFDEKNFVSSDEAIPNKLITGNDSRIFIKDLNGNLHFNSKYRNSRELDEDLKVLLKSDQISEIERIKVLEIYEKVFDHQSFTGRSGTFFKYEGLGSIYWHMVSKLLLSVQEIFYKALESKEESKVLSDIKKIYLEIKEGLGLHKSPDIYGAFPTDAYSHTPENSGVQQPGMTGQVKEDIITRFGELGVRISEGKILFDINLLDKNEFLKQPSTFEYFDVSNKKQWLDLPKDTLGFTLCQLPIIYELSDKNQIKVFGDDYIKEFDVLELDTDLSKLVFRRDKKVKRIKVSFQKEFMNKSNITNLRSI